MAAWRVGALGLAVVPVLLMASCSSGPEDACGNGLGGIKSDVFGVDARSGEVRWTTRLAQADAVVRESAGQARALARFGDEDAVIDVSTGVVVAEPASGDAPPTVDVGTGNILFFDQVVAPVATSNGLSIQTNNWTGTQETDLLLQAQDRSGTEVWSIPLSNDRDKDSVTRPVAFGDTVVVSVARNIPSCSKAAG